MSEFSAARFSTCLRAAILSTKQGSSRVPSRSRSAPSTRGQHPILRVCGGSSGLTFRWVEVLDSTGKGRVHVLGLVHAKGISNRGDDNVESCNSSNSELSQQIRCCTHLYEFVSSRAPTTRSRGILEYFSSFSCPALAVGVRKATRFKDDLWFESSRAILRPIRPVAPSKRTEYVMLMVV